MLSRAIDPAGTAPVRQRSAPAARAPRPLLKWAGGKRQLLPVFRAFYPAAFGRYYEPFLGSGAVFFDLHASGRLDGHAVRLADSNPDLIGCYITVRDRPGDVLAELERLADAHARGGAECYYAVRERFNETRRAGASKRGSRRYTPALAAMLVYLNRTGFNGLFRVNAEGAFNVPAGRYSRPRIADAALVRATASALGAGGVRLDLLPFAEAVADAGRGDFLYCDPPYAPLSSTSAFGAYTAVPFTRADQERLCQTAVALARRGAQVMVSNSSAPAIEALYCDAAEGGLAVWRVPARRSINSRPGLRGPVDELLLTNIEPRAAELPRAVERMA